MLPQTKYQETKRKQPAPGAGFYHVVFFQSWIRSRVEWEMPVHLPHDRMAEQSVFKGQSCFYSLTTPYPTLWLVVFLSVFHPGEDFFLHHFEPAACG